MDALGIEPVKTETFEAPAKQQADPADVDLYTIEKIELAKLL